MPLREAAEYFFDGAKWREFLLCFESAEAALRHLSQPEPGILVFYRRRAAQNPALDGERARKDEKTAELGSSLMADFKERLVKGKLTTTGFSPLAIDQVTIPGARWSDLQPNFVDNTAEGGGLKFTGIRVFEPMNMPRRPAVIDRCAEWLEKRGREGESRRKILLAEALKHFASVLTTRTFGEAYKKAFAKPRGRPRKSGVE